MSTAVTYRRTTALYLCVLIMLAAMTWTFLGMRAVMDVGGACASSGPYDSAQPCPGGAALLSIGTPLMMVTAFAGSALAFGVGAPTLLLPMWWLLFGALGWSFLDHGAFPGDRQRGWLVCGVAFEAMALPAYAALAAAGVALGWAAFRAWS